MGQSRGLTSGLVEGMCWSWTVSEGDDVQERGANLQVGMQREEERKARVLGHAGVGLDACVPCAGPMRARQLVMMAAGPCRPVDWAWSAGLVGPVW